MARRAHRLALILVLCAIAVPAAPERRPDPLARLETGAESASRAAAELIEAHSDWGAARAGRREPPRERREAIDALFAAARLEGSVTALRTLIDTEQSPSTLERGFEILGEDTEAARRAADRAVESCRQAHRGNRRIREAGEHLLDALTDVAGTLDRLARREHRGDGRRLAITELSCPNRRKYSYRMNACIEGWGLDRARLWVQFVKRMNPALDPWRQELGSDVMTSSEVLPDGRERRCYHLRQIGREVRLHQRDNVYLVLERPDGRGRVARACWQENVIELER